MNKRKVIEILKRDFEIVGDGVAHMTTDGKKRLFRKCASCRGYRLERSWCKQCNGNGFVESKPGDTPSI